MNAVAPLIPCIVSGGSGTRLWPVSRESMPKPFMRLADDQSLLQKTFLRIAGLPDVARLLTVTNRDLLFRTLDDYRAVNRSGLAQDLLLEPVGRNTAPAIAAAALHVQEHFGDQARCRRCGSSPSTAMLNWLMYNSASGLFSPRNSMPCCIGERL